MSVKIRLGLTAGCTAVLLAACASATVVNSSGPKLISDAEKQRRDTTVATSGDFNSVHGVPITANVNSDLSSNHDNVWNDGTPFDGLKIVVQGNAFSQGFLGQPQSCQIDVRSKADLNKTSASASAVFKASGAAQYTAIVPSVHCTDSIAFAWQAPALKRGTSNYEVSIAPADNSCPPVLFEHPCIIGAALNLNPASSTDSQPGSLNATNDSQLPPAQR